MSIMPPASEDNHPRPYVFDVSGHVLTGAPPDGLCLVCDECDGNEGHDDAHDCGHR